MFDELLEKLGGALEDLRIPYMVIGGQAVLIYGEPRLTKDIDITLGAGVDRLAEIQSISSTLRLRPLVEQEEEFVNRTLVYPVEEKATGIRVDFIFSFTGYEKQAIERSKRVTIGKTEVTFASVEDLIIHKAVAGRPRDLEDIRVVLLKNPGADILYIKEWLKKFDLSLNGNFLETFLGIVKQIEK